MTALKASVAAVLSLTFLPGCVTPRLSATVEAESSGRSDPGWTYVVVAPNADGGTDSAYGELARQSARMLAAAGLPPPEGGRAADVQVALAYRIEGPRTGGARYERVLELAAATSNHPLWRVTVRSLGYTGDVRHVAPFLLLAAQPYVGRTTAPTRVDLEESDLAAEIIRQGAVRAP